MHHATSTHALSMSMSPFLATGVLEIHRNLTGVTLVNNVRLETLVVVVEVLVTLKFLF